MAAIEAAVRDLKTELSGMLSSLRAVESNVSEVQQDVVEIKLEICGFKHEGRSVPGALERIVDAVESRKR